MNTAEHNADLHAAQECESLAACVARGQEPDSYADIVEKLRGLVAQLPADRQSFWDQQCRALGVVLLKPEPKKLRKPGGDSTP